MKKNRLLIETPAGPLVGGLQWRPPAEGRHTRATLADAAKRVLASHCVMVDAQGQFIYGLWERPLDEFDEQLPPGALSGAALFAHWVGKDAPNAALVVAVPDTAERRNNLYVVVLNDGLPSFDVIGDPSDVARILVEAGQRDASRPFWSSDLEWFPGAHPADLAGLGQAARRDAAQAARIRAIPINPWPPAAVLLLSIAGVAGWWGWSQHKEQVEQERLRAAVAAADPGPKYLRALTAAQAETSADRGEMVQLLRRLYSLPVYVRGWQLKTVECVASGECKATWQRQGGDYNDLKFAGQTLAITDQGARGLDSATTTWSITIPRRALPQPAPTAQAIAHDGGVLWQAWRTAGLNVDLQGAALWPSVPQVPPGFTDPRGLRRGAISLGAVPAPLALDAMASAPGWVSWESVRVDLGDPANGPSATAVQVSLSGYYYVSMQ